MKKNITDNQLKALISSARKDTMADLVLKNARILNVFTGDLENGDVAITGGYIAGIGNYDGIEEIDIGGKIVCPGLIDSHIHIESSMLSPAEFAKAVIPCGTSAVVTDPHEIANVAGGDGISYMLEASKGLPLDVFFMLPSCVPATPLDESGAVLDADALEPFYKEERVLGLAELMNSYGTVRCDGEIMRKIAGANAHGRNVDGHAPLLVGDELNAYVSAGVMSDHECYIFEEAEEKLRRGQWIMIREGTAARNLDALIDLFDDRYCSRCLLVTDDKHAHDLLENGHIDHMIRKAVKAGKSPFNAVKMATLNAAVYFGLKDRGAVAPGFVADLIVVPDLYDFKVEKVFKSGKFVAENGRLTVPVETPVTDEKKYGRVYHSFNMRRMVPGDFKVTGKGSKKRVIKLIPGQIITEEEIVDSSCEEGINKIAVIERHRNTGHTGIGFLSGYGLKKGAVASSIAHDSHNLIVAGTNDEDMALAANSVLENEGGLAIVCDGKVLSTLALPLGGLMCETDVAVLDMKLREMKEQARALGVAEGIDPFMTLAFTALPVIPSIRIVTRGVVDVVFQSYVPVLFD